MYQPSNDIWRLISDVTSKDMSSNFKVEPATDPRFPDLETQKIAEQMEKEGYKLPESNTKPAPVVPKVDEDEDESTPEAQAKAKEEADAKAKVDLEASGDKPDEKPKGDPKETLIVAQKRELKELKEKFESETSELKQQIEKLTTQSKSGSDKTEATKEKVDESAEKLETLVTQIVSENEDVDPKLIKSILAAATAIIGSGNKLSPELTEKLAKFEAREAKLTEQEKEAEIIASETQGFNTEFTTEIAGNEDIKKIIAESGLTVDEVKDKIHDFVYSETGVKYAGVPLAELFTLKKSLFIPDKKKTAEAGRGGSTQGESTGGDFQMKTAAEIQAMSAKEFEAYDKELISHSKSSIMRRGKPIN